MTLLTSHKCLLEVIRHHLFWNAEAPFADRVDSANLAIDYHYSLFQEVLFHSWCTFSFPLHHLPDCTSRSMGNFVFVNVINEQRQPHCYTPCHSWPIHQLIQAAGFTSVTGSVIQLPILDCWYNSTDEVIPYTI